MAVKRDRAGRGQERPRLPARAELPDPLAALRSAQVGLLSAVLERDQAAVAALRGGCTFGAVGVVLGVSRQAVMKRYGALPERPQGRHGQAPEVAPEVDPPRPAPPKRPAE